MKSLISLAFDSGAVEELGVNRDGVLRLSLSGRFGNVRLDALWVGIGWPADVQQVFNRYSPAQLEKTSLVFCAQRMSPGAIRLLAEKEINWADEAGKARIVVPGAVVIRERKGSVEPPPSLSWSPSAIAVGEALLAREWLDGVRTTELANLIQWSPGTVSNVLQRFDEEGWTVKYGPQRGSGAVREISDSAGLLQAWATAVASQDRDLRMTHRTMRSPRSFLENELSGALDEEVRWSLSGWAGAQELAPISDASPTLQIYVHEEDFDRPLDRAIRDAGLSDVAEGGRVSFLRAHPSVLALSERKRIVPVASPPRVYADLLAVGGRGEDAATHLREEVIDHTHPRAGRRPIPSGMLSWERESHERLQRLAADRPALASAYAQGTWSASYRLSGTRKAPNPGKFLAIMREVKGRETGWPPWLVPDTQNDGPRQVDGAIECWFRDTTFGDAAHADYWRADPAGRLCLIRGYQEDSPFEQMAAHPGELLDLTLPILRTGETLLHAARLAHRLDATAVQFMMRWDGLKGRTLTSIVNRNRLLPHSRVATQGEVMSFVELAPGEIETRLAETVKQLTEPLFESFAFFEPPAEIYEEELAALQRGGL